MIRQGKPALEIQNRLGISADFIWQKVSEQASGYSLGRLGELYHRLLDTDIAIKTGKYQPELALSILVAELCQKRGR
jgi:DNA polymerase-3 subunit delta